jgi:hypothetical protein
MKAIYINIIKKSPLTLLAIFLYSITLCSCSEWLDVKPDDQEREDDLYKKAQGFKDALSGCYTTLASQNAYGMRLSMTDVECLAGQWAEPSQTSQEGDYYLYHHQYDNDNARSAIRSMYLGLMNSVAQANLVITHVAGKDGDNIADSRLKNIIHGEALAIRALCQFDLLRLFGQMPDNAVKQVSLPYSEEASINVLPTYYGYKDYIAKVDSDLCHAERYLYISDNEAQYQDNPPAIDKGTDNFYTDNRTNHLNYWAVRALKARFYLYTGQTDKAYREAKAILQAHDEDGNTHFQLSSRSDYQNGYYATPSECIFALSVDGLGDYAVSTLGGDASAALQTNTQYHITSAMYSQLYVNTQSDTRYINLWEQTKNGGVTYPTIKKYYYDTSTTYDQADLLTRREIVPIVRLSEMYLIAMETTHDLIEANSLYKTYMRARNVSVNSDFASLDAVKTEVEKEYLRDFYAEGQMFFVYKRLSATHTNWNNGELLNEDQYILPLPSSEYDPADR